MTTKNTIADIHQKLTAKKMSAVELTQETIKKAKQKNQDLSCILHFTEEKALLQAKKVDQLLANNTPISPLAGIPIIYKDNFNTVGDITSCASKILKDYRSVYDATVVKHMQDAESICIAKANMDEFAMGSTNENSAFGAVKNPHHLEHCAGGSSGGSAAAVAADMAPVAFGSDTGGSVRQPASFCGVVGLKPTYGRLSRFGIVAFASSFDQPGILTHSAYDNALVLNQVAKYDSKDSTCVNAKTTDYLKNIDTPLTGKKIGLFKNLFDRVNDTEAQKCFEEAIQNYQKLGVEFIEVELPNPELSVAAYYVLSSSECSSNLSRFDGVRYGYRSQHSDSLEDMYIKSRSEGFGAEVKRRILLGTFALSTGYYDAYYLKAQKMRRAVLNHFNLLFKSVDCIMLPTSLITAPRLGEDFSYNDDMCTISANLAGIPGISHPIGFSKGLPVGMQVLGKHFAEAELLNIVNIYQKSY